MFGKGLKSISTRGYTWTENGNPNDYSTIPVVNVYHNLHFQDTVFNLGFNIIVGILTKGLSIAWSTASGVATSLINWHPEMRTLYYNEKQYNHKVTPFIYRMRVLRFCANKNYTDVVGEDSVQFGQWSTSF